MLHSLVLIGPATKAPSLVPQQVASAKLPAALHPGRFVYMPETTSTTPQSLAVATQTIVKNIVPKPTKAQLLRATARAVSLERRVIWRKLIDEKDAIAKKIKEMAAKMAARTIQPTDVSVMDWSTDSVSVSTCVRTKDHPELLPLLKKHNDLYNQIGRIQISEESILKELREKTDNPDAAIDAMLGDEKIKKKLADIGKKLLDSVTQMEKAAAITA